jgi:hydrogenase nickel incorporation protein HypA/HybF
MEFLLSLPLSNRMHEFSIAGDVLNAAIMEAGKHNASRIKSISIDVGGLMQVNPEQFEFALKSLSMGTIAEGAEIELRTTPVRFECVQKHVNELDLSGMDLQIALSGLRCPECKGAVKILSGKECILRRIIAE